jgi:hypothetical protein
MTGCEDLKLTVSFRASVAALASSTVLIVTNPKRLLRPLYLSYITCTKELGKQFFGEIHYLDIEQALHHAMATCKLHNYYLV